MKTHQVIIITLIGFVFGLFAGYNIDKRKEKQLDVIIAETKQVQEEAKEMCEETRALRDKYFNLFIK